jgi:hypothetical protein
VTDEASAPPSGLTLQDLRSTAEVLEREVVAAGRGSDADLDARRPGSGPDYPELTPQAWLAYALWLAERLGGARDLKGGRSLDQVLQESLADTPAPVTLASGAQIAIHPKSLYTLCILEGLDADLQQVLDEMRDIAADVAEGEVPTADGAAVQLMGALLKGRALSIYAWILSHPGPGIPFTETEPDPAAPEWTRELTGADLEAIVRGHLQVNRTDLDFLAQAFPSDEARAKSRLPLGAFLGGYANEIGKKPRTLMRRWTWRSVFAGALVRAESMREAMKKPRDTGA